MSTRANPRPFVPYEHRDRHVYLVGKSGHGKSTLMERAIMQDIENGAGVILLDAKGDLAQSVLDHIPYDHVHRTIHLDAGEPVPIDFMSWETDTERQTLSTDIYQTFMSFSESPPGDRWVSVLRKTITTLLDARGCSFLDINDFIEFPSYRENILTRVKDERAIHYWKNVFPKYPSDAAFPILTRMGQFMDSAPLLTLLGRSTPPPGKKLLSLYDVMQERKIPLVDLAGAGKSNANDIGRLLMSKIQQAAFRRRNPAERIPCFLYVDEFQNFQTSAFDVILSEARAFKLCLTLANQGLYQLDEKIKNAIFGNVSALWVLFVESMARVKSTPISFRQVLSGRWDDPLSGCGVAAWGVVQPAMRRPGALEPHCLVRGCLLQVGQPAFLCTPVRFPTERSKRKSQYHRRYSVASRLRPKRRKIRRARCVNLSTRSRRESPRH